MFYYSMIDKNYQLTIRENQLQRALKCIRCMLKLHQKLEIDIERDVFWQHR